MSTANEIDGAGTTAATAGIAPYRLFAWAVVALMTAFVANNFLIFVAGAPSVIDLVALAQGEAAKAPIHHYVLTPLVYVIALMGALLAVREAPGVATWAVGFAVAAGVAIGGLAAITPEGPPALSAVEIALVAALALTARYGLLLASAPRDALELRDDSERMHAANLYLIRAAFWAVLFIGFADALISFWRVEGLLEGVSADLGRLLVGLEGEAATAFGDRLGSDLGRSQFRGPWVHLPLVALGAIVALFTRTLGFQWLALFVVIAELGIVLGRFVFSYEQTFMSDLVRFWYAGLFLFASAYTLYEDGHVRVDVAYAGFSDAAKGWVNAIGSLLLGAVLCWVILLLALFDQASIVNSALLAFETSQSGFGMYIKYWMAVFLAVFAITMLVQFMSYFLESVADIRRDPGKRKLSSENVH